MRIEQELSEKILLKQHPLQMADNMNKQIRLHKVEKPFSVTKGQPTNYPNK